MSREYADFGSVQDACVQVFGAEKTACAFRFGGRYHVTVTHVCKTREELEELIVYFPKAKPKTVTKYTFARDFKDEFLDFTCLVIEDNTETPSLANTLGPGDCVTDLKVEELVAIHPFKTSPLFLEVAQKEDVEKSLKKMDSGIDKEIFSMAMDSDRCEVLKLSEKSSGTNTHGWSGAPFLAKTEQGTYQLAGLLYAQLDEFILVVRWSKSFHKLVFDLSTALDRAENQLRRDRLSESLNGTSSLDNGPSNSKEINIEGWRNVSNGQNPTDEVALFSSDILTAFEYSFYGFVSLLLETNLGILESTPFLTECYYVPDSVHGDSVGVRIIYEYIPGNSAVEQDVQDYLRNQIFMCVTPKQCCRFLEEVQQHKKLGFLSVHLHFNLALIQNNMIKESDLMAEFTSANFRHSRQGGAEEEGDGTRARMKIEQTVGQTKWLPPRKSACKPHFNVSSSNPSVGNSNPSVEDTVFDEVKTYTEGVIKRDLLPKMSTDFSTLKKILNLSKKLRLQNGNTNFDSAKWDPANKNWQQRSFPKANMYKVT